MVKKIKKNRTILTISTIAVLMVMALAGMWLRTYLKSTAETRLAQQFGEQVK
jgi:multidrug resistance efflux pump